VLLVALLSPGSQVGEKFRTGNQRGLVTGVERSPRKLIGMDLWTPAANRRSSSNCARSAAAKPPTTAPSDSPDGLEMLCTCGRCYSSARVTPAKRPF
jgi:hypothetical protein